MGREIKRQWHSPLPCHRNHQMSQQVLGRAGQLPLILPEHASSRESSEGQVSHQGHGPCAGASKLRRRPGEAGKPWLCLAAHSHLPLHMNYREEASGQLASRPALPLSGTRKCFVQPNTSLSGISVTPERANNGVSVTHVAQMPLPAQTCP